MSEITNEQLEEIANHPARWSALQPEPHTLAAELLAARKRIAELINDWAETDTAIRAILAQHRITEPNGEPESSLPIEDGVRQLSARVAELEKDRARLEAMSNNLWSVTYNGYILHCWIVQRWDQVCGNIGKGKTAQEAIDAAINQKAE